jgi:hypothetical protein
MLASGKKLSLRTKIKDILGDEWVLKDKYAEERLDLTDLLSRLPTPKSDNTDLQACEAVYQVMTTQSGR